MLSSWQEKVRSVIERDVLKAAAREWCAFYHAANIAAARLHTEGLLERRHWDFGVAGGYEYRITEAGRLSLQGNKHDR